VNVELDKEIISYLQIPALVPTANSCLAKLLNGD
jgi:hypothetical protein